MHASRDGRLYFKDVQNINAKLDSYMRNMLMEGKEKELKKRARGNFRTQQEGLLPEASLPARHR